MLSEKDIATPNSQKANSSHMLIKNDSKDLQCSKRLYHISNKFNLLFIKESWNKCFLNKLFVHFAKRDFIKTNYL